MATFTRKKYDDKGWLLSCRITVSNGLAADGSQKREGERDYYLIDVYKY